VDTPHLPERRDIPQTFGRVLVVDDEIELMRALCEALTRQGYEVSGFANGREALAALEARDVDILLTDLMMPEPDGLALLRAALKLDPHVVVILMIGQGTVPTAIEAMQSGAFDYVLKPFKLQALAPVLVRAMNVRRLRLENIELRDTLAVHELSQTIAYTLDTDAILNKVADVAAAQFQADEVSIMLLHGPSQLTNAFDDEQ